MSRALKSYVNPALTPQTKPLLKGTPQVKNAAGGYVYKVSPEQALRRFLILGSDGGTYYIGERDLTKQNSDLLDDIFQSNPKAAAEIITLVSQAGIAPKVSPALFALAKMISHPNTVARDYAVDIFPQVARNASHLFEFVSYANGMRGWGRRLKNVVANWYGWKPNKHLAYQMIKYQQRSGFSHRDLFRLCHFRPDEVRQPLIAYAMGKEVDMSALPPLVGAFEAVKKSTNVKEVISLINEFGLTHEMIPNQWKSEPAVWEALLFADMPLTAVIRNLATMTRVGLLGDFSNAQSEVVRKLGDSEALKAARIHPLSVLNGLMAYAGPQHFSGGGVYQDLRGKGTGDKSPNRAVINALEGAFYETFKYAPKSGKSFMLALDCSGSMTYPIAGMNMSCIQAETALAMVLERSEPNSLTYRFDSAFQKVNLAKDLQTSINRVYQGNFGSTDCSLPMLYALKNKIKVDVFVVITDNETYAGKVHPSVALREYRDKVNPNAKQVVIGMTATNVSIADPADIGTMDVVGFDTSVPSVLTDFALGSV